MNLAFPVDDAPLAVPNPERSSILHRSLSNKPLLVSSGKGSYLHLDDGREILDACSGAAVACIGHGDERVTTAMMEQMAKVSYVHAQIYTSRPAEDLADLLVKSTDGKMSHVLFMSSGSEATETALKLSRQYYLELQPPQPTRHIFISRRQSYHGATLAALAVSGHTARRANFEPLMLPHMRQVSPCNSYRFRFAGETDEVYVARLAKELEVEIVGAGPHNVCAFIAETVVGATTGCVPPVPGYIQAIRDVCDRYGVLLILDEIMCGNGRCGSMHAWQHEGVAPDIQTMGKGLGGGYQPIAAVLLNAKVQGALQSGTGSFAHGQTYQSHVLSCVAALQVQQIIQSDNLVVRCQVTGKYLEALLYVHLKEHPNVGDIRGLGLFWGVEFVKDRTTKEPFNVSKGIANAVHLLALQKDVAVYPGVGTVDGVHGDHVLVAPPYNISKNDVEKTVLVLKDSIEEIFQKISS